MIDLHSHILPGIDDGPATLEESVGLAELYAEAGFSKVVATPHFVPGTAWTPGADVIRQGVVDLNCVLEKKKIAVRVYAGMEIAMDSGIAWLVSQGRIIGIAETSYLLIEAPFYQMPLGWEQVFFPLSAKGYRIILAHPERCGQFAANPAMFDQFIAAGVYLQVNYDSFLGGYGRQAEETAFMLAEKGYIHCLATDSHDLVHRHPGRVGKAREAIGKVVGAEAVEVMARANPERVVAGEGLVSTGAVRSGKNQRGKKWWLF